MVSMRTDIQVFSSGLKNERCASALYNNLPQCIMSKLESEFINSRAWDSEALTMHQFCFISENGKNDQLHFFII